MFPDSEIAQQFHIGKDKLAYLSIFGLAPYFRKTIYEQLKKCQFISVSYDKALNKVAQKTQMDIHVIFQDPETGFIVTNYLTSEFLESTKSEDLLQHFQHGLGLNNIIDPAKIINVAMDGPNVNWKMLRLLKQELGLIPECPKLVDFGSCALHVVNGAFKYGHQAAKWEVFDYLRAS